MSQWPIDVIDVAVPFVYKRCLKRRLVHLQVTRGPRNILDPLTSVPPVSTEVSGRNFAATSTGREEILYGAYCKDKRPDVHGQDLLMRS